MDFSPLSMKQLVTFYNRHAARPVNRFSDRRTAERRCLELFNSLKTNDPIRVMKQKADKEVRISMQTSLKLNRTVTCLDTGEVWKNAHQMWKENPDWMTTGQQDRLTAQLYAAAKQGERKEIAINGRTFCLVDV